MILYPDTSALVKLYMLEEDRETVLDAFQRFDQQTVSVIAHTELRSALGRRLREGCFEANCTARRSNA